MNLKLEVHKNNYELKLNRIPEWKIPESTKKEVKDFINKAKIGQINQGKKLSDRTLSKYLSLLKTSLELINKQTSKLNKGDIEEFDKKLTKKGLKSSSGYRLCLQVFLKYKLGDEKSDKLAGWLDTRDRNKTPDYLSEQEVEKLFKNCKSDSERYLIAVLFCSGARIEEFLNIRYEDIQLPEGDNAFVRLTLKVEYSKTNGRNISLYWKHCLNAVRDYLSERIKEGIRSDEPVYTAQTYDGLRSFLGRLGKKVLKKKVTPHLFRHGSATYYANKLNRQELCYRYGWAFSSDMPDIYISRSGMTSKYLDEKFKATELEEVEKKFEIEKFQTRKELTEVKNELGQYKINNAEVKNEIVEIKELLLKMKELYKKEKAKRENDD